MYVGKLAPATVVFNSDVDRGQTPEDEDEAEDNLPRPRPRTKFRPRGQSDLEDLTSLVFNSGC